MKKPLRYEECFLEIIDELMKFRVGEFKRMPWAWGITHEIYERPPSEYRGRKILYRFVVNMNKLFYEGQIPFFIDLGEGQDDGYFIIERYGDSFDNNKYSKYINNIKIKREQTTWVRNVL